MSKVILDSSAFLALINNETGKDMVEALLHNTIMSSVNVSEVVSVLSTKLFMPEAQISKILALIPEVYPFDKSLALSAGLFEHAGLDLSLGDRACITLALLLSLPVYTADPVLDKLDIGITINQIR